MNNAPVPDVIAIVHSRSCPLPIMEIDPTDLSQFLVTPKHGEGKLLSVEGRKRLKRDRFGRLMPARPIDVTEKQRLVAVRAIRRAKKEMVPAVLAELYNIAMNGGTRVDARVRAAQILLEHVLGKPAAITVAAPASGPVQMSWEALLKSIKDTTEPTNTDEEV